MNNIKDIFNKFVKTLEKGSCWYRSIVILAVLYLLVSAYRKFSTKKEGFIQSENLVIKQDDKIFDDFYASVYDILFNQKVDNDYEVGMILNKFPDISNQSVVLDIGSRTGDYVESFRKNKFQVVGIEQSKALIDQANKKYPGIEILNKSPLESGTFPDESFTLVTLLNLEVYYIPNTRQLFQNIYGWLKPGGFFVLHLVDPERFNHLVPAAKSVYMQNPNSIAQKRMTEAVVKFNDFDYISNYQIFPNDFVQYMEVFKDKNGKVRKNIRNIRFPTQETFIKIANEVGFNMLSEIDLVKANKPYEFFYLFYKPAN